MYLKLESLTYSFSYVVKYVPEVGESDIFI